MPFKMKEGNFDAKGRGEGEILGSPELAFQKTVSVPFVAETLRLFLELTAPKGVVR